MVPKSKSVLQTRNQIYLLGTTFFNQFQFRNTIGYFPWKLQQFIHRSAVSLVNYAESTKQGVSAFTRMTLRVRDARFMESNVPMDVRKRLEDLGQRRRRVSLPVELHRLHTFRQLHPARLQTKTLSSTWVHTRTISHLHLLVHCK